MAKSNAWTTGRRFLVVPYYLIGATSVESALLGHYAEHARAMRPAAATPGFYQADRLSPTPAPCAPTWATRRSSGL